jgi:hypothetical protein
VLSLVISKEESEDVYICYSRKTPQKMLFINDYCAGV